MGIKNKPLHTAIDDEDPESQGPIRWDLIAGLVIVLGALGWYLHRTVSSTESVGSSSGTAAAGGAAGPNVPSAPRTASACPAGKYCRQVLSWSATSCLHTYPLKAESVEAKKAKLNARFFVGPEFALVQTEADEAAEGNSTAGGATTAHQPRCTVASKGRWASPISLKLLRSAVAYFRHRPQTNCTIDLLETPLSIRWRTVTTAAPVDGLAQLSTTGLAYAELQHSHCALVRLTDPFDVLAHLHAALERGNAARVAGGSATKGTVPRVDLVGDESHRALFFRIVAFFRRQPISFDLDDVNVKRITYRIFWDGDEIVYHMEEIRATVADELTLFEMNFVYQPDDANVASMDSLARGLDGIMDGVSSGNLVLGVLGVAYKPSNDCTIDSKPFADGLLKTWKTIHDLIEDVMPLDPTTGIALRNATAFTLLSKTAHVPELKRGDMLTKRNSHTRHFITRHRQPYHTVYLSHDSTDGDAVPHYHTERRLGLLDVHRFLTVTPHAELEYERYGDPARSFSACTLKDWTTTAPPTEMRIAGACRDWISLGVFQLMLTYALAENPQWSKM